MLKVRLAQNPDIDSIMEVIAKAKLFMRANGNLTQWAGEYPSKALMLEEIAQSHCYVVMGDNDRIVGTFCFILGEDPTYIDIYPYEGKCSWLNSQRYGTIHRLASDGSVKGVGNAVFKYAHAIIDNLRADTHQDNIPMQKLLEKYGFKLCGLIRLADGSPRLAYHLD